MNKIFKKGEEKCMSKLRLRQPGFTLQYLWTVYHGKDSKHPERTQKFKERCDLDYISKSQLVKACFVHDA